MNERIKQFAEQAGLKVESWMTNPPKPFQILGSAEQFEKFAELILKDVRLVMQAAANDFILDENYDAVKGVGRCMRMVRQHFGVEE